MFEGPKAVFAHLQLSCISLVGAYLIRTKMNLKIHPMRTYNFVLILPFLTPLGNLILAQVTVPSTSDPAVRHFAWQATYQNGHVFSTNTFLAGSNAEGEAINTYASYSMQFGNQTTGRYAWEENYNYPYWGGGVAVVDFHEPEFLGTPITVYGFFNAPFKRWRKWSFDYNIELGLTFNWKPFNPLNNPDNISIGAGRTVHISLGAEWAYQLSPRLSTVLGFNLTHFSNGALKKPNYGINTIAPHLRLRYHLRREEIRFQHHNLTAMEPQFEWNLFLFGGAKNVVFNDLNVDIIEKYEGVQFPVLGLSTSLNRQISYKSKLGVGLTLDYDSSHNAQVAIDEGDLETTPSPFVDKIQLSVSPIYELVIDRFSIVLQPSFYLYRKKINDLTPNFYQRFGLKYHLGKRYFVGINLRAFNFRVSDFIEWHMGYRLVWR